jgi:hypothetical protein
MSGQTPIMDMHEDEAVLPLDARMVLTALETAGWEKERRQRRRSDYRVAATLRMFADAPAARARILYTRDANQRGIGFITRERLPLGYGGMLRLPSPKTAKTLNIACTLYRCRMAAPGWYEGAVHFNRDQAEFLADEANPGDEE